MDTGQIVETIPLVYKVAGIWNAKTPPIVAIEDLRSAGFVGLMKASERYDKKLGDFRKYAYSRIRGEILDFLRKGEGWRRYHGPAKFDYLDEDTEEALSLRETLPDPRQNTRARQHRKDIRREICKAKALLRPMQKHMLEMYYFQGYVFQEIADIYGCTEGNVCTHVRRSLEKLKSNLSPEILNQN